MNHTPGTQGPTPRYRIGDRVWRGGWTSTTKQHLCPDCKGSRQWTATTPAGETISLECPRCTGYSNTKLPSLTQRVAIPSVEARTIGSIRTDSAARPGEQVSYMCRETGIGTGTIYHEDALYGTESEARAAAEALVAKKNEEYGAEPQAVTVAYFAELPMKAAVPLIARYDTYHAWTTARTYRETIDAILEDENMDSARVRELLSEAILDRPWRTPNPMDALLTACKLALKAYEHIGHGCWPVSDENPQGLLPVLRAAIAAAEGGAA